MKKLMFFILSFVFLAFSCAKKEAPRTTIESDPIEPDILTNTTLLSVSGRQIIDANNSPIQLQSVGFNNWHWIEDPLPPTTHHTEIDFTRVSNIDMNVVRFAVNYWIFEDDASPYTYKQTGWDWIESNIE